ncbi:MAG: hypothetical protein HZA79_12730 [Sphingobacteriales bacterium]|nr:hypothetical protein [Sphingobacteriales bacterium]
MAKQAGQTGVALTVAMGIQIRGYLCNLWPPKGREDGKLYSFRVLSCLFVAITFAPANKSVFIPAFAGPLRSEASRQACNQWPKKSCRRVETQFSQKAPFTIPYPLSSILPILQISLTK